MFGRLSGDSAPASRSRRSPRGLLIELLFRPNGESGHHGLGLVVGWASTSRIARPIVRAEQEREPRAAFELSALRGIVYRMASASSLASASTTDFTEAVRRCSARLSRPPKVAAPRSRAARMTSVSESSRLTVSVCHPLPRLGRPSAGSAAPPQGAAPAPAQTTRCRGRSSDRGPYLVCWLARKDSNLRSPDPESGDMNRGCQPIFELSSTSRAV
jgi:hypothetical protein